MNIKKSAVLVTGANRGLGRAIVDGLLATGAAKVYAAARDPSTITLQGVEANGLHGELRAQGTQVVDVRVGFMETDMTKGLDTPKAGPKDVVQQTLAAIEAGHEEVLADALSRSVRQGLTAERGVYLGEAVH